MQELILWILGLSTILMYLPVRIICNFTLGIEGCFLDSQVQFVVCAIVHTAYYVVCMRVCMHMYTCVRTYFCGSKPTYIMLSLCKYAVTAGEDDCCCSWPLKAEEGTFHVCRQRRINSLHQVLYERGMSFTNTTWITGTHNLLTDADQLFTRETGHI